MTTVTTVTNAIPGGRQPAAPKAAAPKGRTAALFCRTCATLGVRREADFYLPQNGRRDGHCAEHLPADPAMFERLEPVEKPAPPAAGLTPAEVDAALERATTALVAQVQGIVNDRLAPIARDVDMKLAQTLADAKRAATAAVDREQQRVNRELEACATTEDVNGAVERLVRLVQHVDERVGALEQRPAPVIDAGAFLVAFSDVIHEAREARERLPELLAALGHERTRADAAEGSALEAMQELEQLRQSAGFSAPAGGWTADGAENARRLELADEPDVGEATNGERELVGVVLTNALHLTLGRINGVAGVTRQLGAGKPAEKAWKRLDGPARRRIATGLVRLARGDARAAAYPLGPEAQKAGATHRLRCGGYRVLVTSDAGGYVIEDIVIRSDSTIYSNER